MIWALERSAPSMLYLLFDAQPPRITPYTARLPAANTNRIPMSNCGAMTNWNSPGTAELGPNGTTEKAMNVVKTEMLGARKYRTLSTCAGTTSSFKRNLAPSASGCSNPKMPTRFGPIRSWTQAASLRSSQIKYAQANMVPPSTTPMASTLCSIGCMTNLDPGQATCPTPGIPNSPTSPLASGANAGISAAISCRSVGA